MGLYKFLPGNHHAGEQSGTVIQCVPFLGQVQRHPQPLNFALGHGDKGLGQQRNRGCAGGQGRHTLAVLAFPVNDHVRIRVNSIFREQIPQGILRRGALSGSHNGFALQIRKGLHGVAVFHHVEDA